MKRAAVILTSNVHNPFYGIVTFDDDGIKWYPASEDVEAQTVIAMEVLLDEAVKADFHERWEAPEGDSPDNWFESILGDYTYFYIPVAEAKKLAEVEFPCHTNCGARVSLEQLMISVCEKFAYTSRFSRLA